MSINLAKDDLQICRNKYEYKMTTVCDLIHYVYSGKLFFGNIFTLYCSNDENTYFLKCLASFNYFQNRSYLAPEN